MFAELIYQLLIAVVVVVFSLSIVIYFYLKRRYAFWKNLGVPGPEPRMLFGNTEQLARMTKTDAELTNIFYEAYSGEEYIGYYSFWDPVLLAIDLGLVNRIMKNDFDHFAERPPTPINVYTDSILISLFSLTGNVWKSRRATLTRLFTPRKLKDYIEEMQSCVSELIKDFEARKGEDFELARMVEPHAVNSICKVLYGLDLSQDKEKIVQLVKYADFFSRPPASLVIKTLGRDILPAFFKLLKIPVFPPIVFEFFADFTNKMTEARQKNNVERNDLVNMIMKLREDGMTFEESVGHLYILFQASYDTTELTICHTFLQLALNPEVQEKAIKEIDTVLNGTETITYEVLSQLNYLDGIISETLRLYPPVGTVQRVCTKPYKINDKVTLPKGVIVNIPISSIQMDPNHYPDPEKFIPERFLDGKNKDAWLPFGIGPKACIGLRLGLLTPKLILARTLSQFKILLSDKMTLPMKFDPKTIVFTSRPIDGFWLSLKKRDSNSLN